MLETLTTIAGCYRIMLMKCAAMLGVDSTGGQAEAGRPRRRAR